ncbi:hypothetical protein [Clostridium estertheticum]|uniref:hypothetical protein n=1 Tax=Clostridium estertheticum TaxID=238834 RepID=UPI0029623108|nr:hypothetical protein [Clostridium estertheticum]
METVQNLDATSKLDSKTEELAYIAVLASARLDGGLPSMLNMQNHLELQEMK